jgi:hypothetical protein
MVCLAVAWDEAKSYILVSGFILDLALHCVCGERQTCPFERLDFLKLHNKADCYTACRNQSCFLDCMQLSVCTVA